LGIGMTPGLTYTAKTTPRRNKELNQKDNAPIVLPLMENTRPQGIIPKVSPKLGPSSKLALAKIHTN